MSIFSGLFPQENKQNQVDDLINIKRNIMYLVNYLEKPLVKITNADVTQIPIKLQRLKQVGGENGNLQLYSYNILCSFTFPFMDKPNFGINEQY